MEQILDIVLFTAFCISALGLSVLIVALACGMAAVALAVWRDSV